MTDSLNDDVEDLARQVLALCAEAGIMLALAESCTGGMVSAALTALPGSSAVVDRGFVTYSNAAKREMLGVRHETLEARGAVSRETAIEMAEGALARSQAGCAVSITGIAGPGGGSAEKPVGLVWFGVAVKDGIATASHQNFPDGGRDAVRRMATGTALRLVAAALTGRQASRGTP